jgi:hypothetical protein
MSIKSLFGLFLIAVSFGFVTDVSAQDLTHAKVRAELSQVENNGSRFVTDTSYLDVNRIFTQKVARLKKQLGASDVGGTQQGKTRLGMRGATINESMNNACVGPRT